MACIVLIQALALISLLDNVYADTEHQNEDNLEVTLHCKLESNSEEIQSEIMGLGTYSYFEEPELDISSSEHDITNINVNSLQYPTYNRTNNQSSSFVYIDTNYTNTNIQVGKYDVSAPLDTRINLRINYNGSIRYDLEQGDSYSTQGSYTQSDLQWDGSYWWVITEQLEYAYKYTENWAYVTKVRLYEHIDGALQGLYWNGSVFAVVYSIVKYVCLYDSDFNYLGEEFYVGSQVSSPYDVYHNGTNWFVLSSSSEKVYMYDNNWNYIKVFDTSAQLENPYSLYSDGYNWYILDIYSNDKIYKYNLDFSYTNYYINVDGNLLTGISTKENLWYGVSAGAGAQGVIELIPDISISEDIKFIDFTYNILGVNYTETLSLILDDTLTNFTFSNGNLTYYTTSSEFSHYNHTHDLSTSAQNLTLTFEDIFIDVNINLTFYCEYSSSSWRVPTEINLEINNEEVTDQSYNSGIISFTDFPNTLIVEANEDVLYSLEIRTDFSFTFDLEVISKTYLKKTFELVSDHSIVIEQIDLDSNLNLKKVYLNNIDYGSNTPVSLSIEMNEGNIFVLEVILAESIYIPLNYMRNTLGSGTASILLFGYSNALIFNNIDRHQNLDIFIPADWNSQHANLTFSNVLYDQYYESNNTHNTYGLYQETQSYIDPTVAYENSTEGLSEIEKRKETSCLNESNFEFINGSLLQNGTDYSEINNNYAKFKSSNCINFLGEPNATTSSLSEMESWSDISDGSDSDVSVYSEIDGHTNVIKLRDNDATGDGTAVGRKTLDPTYETGTIEFWIRTTDEIGGTYGGVRLRIFDDSENLLIDIIIDSYDLGKFEYYVPGTGWVEFATGKHADDQWFHIRIDFNTTSDTYDLYLDKNLELDDVAFRVVGNNLSHFDFLIGASDGLKGIAYVDAIRYSWDDGYSLYDNYDVISSELNFTTALEFNINALNYTISEFNFLFSYKTNISQLINIYLYNFNTLQYDELYVNSSTAFYNFEALINATNYYNSSFNIILKFQGFNSLESFEFYLEQLGVEVLYTMLFRSNPSLSVVFQNPVYINQIFNVTIIASKSHYNISEIRFWDSISNNNISVGTSEGQYNVTLQINLSQYYTLWCFANDTQGNWRYVNITNLFVRKKACFIDYLNLKNTYEQNVLVLVNVSLKDSNNIVLTNENLNFIFTNQTNDVLNQSILTTDSYGNVQFYFQSNYSHISFFHLNFTFTSNEYLNYSKMMSFEIIPIPRLVNSSEINLKVNAYDVGADNTIQINNSNSFTLSCLDNSTFNLQIVFFLNYAESFSYSNYLNYDFSFSASTDISYIVFTSANMTNIPTNFTNFYFNDIETSNYLLTGNNLEISDLIGDIYYNDNDFNVKLRYVENTIIREQLTANPRTDSDEVVFRETLLANRTFSFWYFHNSLSINSVSLNHTRTGTIISSFEEENNNYYFEQSCLSNDVFVSTTNYDPNWDLDCTLITNTGTEGKIKIDYKADLEISNVTIVFNLRSYDIYMESWSHNATQSYLDFVIEIPNVNFTTSIQSITLIGTSSVPHIFLTDLENEDSFEISDDNWEDLDEWCYGYLDINRYSKSFVVSDLDDDWELDGIHYMGKDYDLESSGYFECPGWGGGITSAYLRFKTNPITNLEREQRKGSVKYTIDSEFELDDVDITVYVEEDERYNKANVRKELKEELDCIDVISLYSNENKDYYLIVGTDLEEGENEIKITYTIENVSNYGFLLLLVGCALLGFLFLFIQIRKKETGKYLSLEMFKFWKKGFLAYWKNALMFWKSNRKKKRKK